MNIKRDFINSAAFGAIVFAFSAFVALGQAGPPEPTRTEVSRYGMHFIEHGRSVRVSVAHPQIANPGEIIPCIRVRIVFDVYEAAGDGSVRLRFSRRVTRETELDGGEAASFDFVPSRSGDWIAPSVFAHCEENCPSDPSRISVLSTLSIRQGGNTVLLLPAVLKGFDPQPDPPASLVQ
ncbi:MAG TPA: hypothetical protein VL572_09100 [Pyrinomonadaceae bacterium]|nr:hypothetical protein [Pyrinomonadaceae bacterium]